MDGRRMKDGWRVDGGSDSERKVSTIYNTK